MDQLLHIRTEGLQQDKKDNYFYHRYEPTPYLILKELCDELSITSKDIFLDFGCGKGRLNFYIHHRFQCRTIGIEFSEQYYQDAIKNLKSYNGRMKNKITFLHTLAQNYTIQAEDTFFYFFNPFSIEIFMQVISRCLESQEKYPRKLTIILYYPDYNYIYFLENSSPFTLSKTIRTSLYNQDSKEHFIVYEYSNI